MASRLILIAILAAASAAALLWGLRPGTPPAPAADAGVNPRTATPAAPAPAAAGTPASAAATASIGGEAPPPGLTAAQWAQVQERLAGHPQAAAERDRLRRYFAWSDAVQRWRGARQDLALAQQVDAGLPERLAQAEVSAPEARQLKAALLQTLLPDEASRTAALQAFDATLPRPAGPTPRDLEFQRRQSALVAAWQAQPASQRDPAALQRQIDALRRSHYPKETPR